VVRGHCGPHEDEVVVEVRAVQDLAAHRVDEGLGQFGLVRLGQPPHVVALHGLPDDLALRRRLVLRVQPLHGFLDALVVEGDAFARQPADAVEVAGLEAGFGLLRVVTEQPVVSVEPGQDGVRDAGREVVGSGAGGDGGRDGIRGHGAVARAARRRARRLDETAFSNGEV
jgi:hypothetical protein